MSIDNFAVIVATLLGPVFAVQAQKAIERFNEAKKQKFEVFRTLMVTRGTRLAYEHVRALNSIDLVFSTASKKDKAVIERWRLYAQNLGMNFASMTDPQRAVWSIKNNDLFMALLESMAEAVGFPVERERLEGAAYHPVGHFEIEQLQKKALENVARVFSGEQPLLVTTPQTPESLERQNQIQAGLSAALSDGTIRVKLEQ